MTISRHQSHRISSEERVSTSRLPLAGLAAFFLSSMASLLMLNLMVRVFALPADFPPFQPFAVAGSIFVGVLGAVVALAVINRASLRPVRTFRIVAVVALLLSFVPNILFLAGGDSVPIPGISVATMSALAVLHVVTAAVTVGILTTWPRER